MDYRYKACGLDNVVLKGLEVRIDDEGDEVITLPSINLIHKALLKAVVGKPFGLNGKEVKFVRSEIGLTQAELGQIVGKDGQTIGRWERNEHPIEQSADTLIRMAALKQLEFNAQIPDLRELAARGIQSSVPQQYVIDASNPDELGLVA